MKMLLFERRNRMKGRGLLCGEKTSVFGLLQLLPLSFVPLPKLLDFCVLLARYSRSLARQSRCPDHSLPFPTTFPMDNHDGTRSSVGLESRPTVPVHPLNVNDVDNSLAAAQQSDIAVRANLLPALGITTGHNTRSRSVCPPNLTHPHKPTTSPRTTTLNSDRPDTLAKPPAKKRRAVRPRPEPIIESTPEPGFAFPSCHMTISKSQTFVI
jgi:hypothetical protein